MCEMHRRRARVHGDPTISLLNRSHDGVCTVEGCGEPYGAAGLCDKHYQRRRKTGRLDNDRDLTLDERFWSRVVEGPGGCWLWIGYLDKDGYGVFHLGHSQPVRAHRWSYEQMVGPIPDGLAIDHLCRIVACVNPYHLDPVTTAVNNERRDLANR